MHYNMDQILQNIEPLHQIKAKLKVPMLIFYFGILMHAHTMFGEFMFPKKEHS